MQSSGTCFFDAHGAHAFPAPQPQLQKPLQFEQSHDLLANQLVQKDSVQLAQNCDSQVLRGLQFFGSLGVLCFPSKHGLLAVIRPQQPVTNARFYICAVLSRDVVELVHDGGGLWMQIGRGT